MCLEIIVQIPKDSKKRVNARRLSKLTGLKVKKIWYNDGPALHFSISKECSCDFMDDNTDFYAPVWHLNPIHLSALAEAIAMIGKKIGQFSFLVHWLGLDSERTRDEHQTKLIELLNDIRANKIKNNWLYKINS